MGNNAHKDLEKDMNNLLKGFGSMAKNFQKLMDHKINTLPEDEKIKLQAEMKKNDVIKKANEAFLQAKQAAKPFKV